MEDDRLVGIKSIPLPPEVKIKKWDHIAIRPFTFHQFRLLRAECNNPILQKSDDAFLNCMMDLYIKLQQYKKTKGVDV